MQEAPDRYVERNDTLTFAEYTRKNLAHIEQAQTNGADVHVVTQLTLALLGLIVFPKEKYLEGELSSKRLDELATSGWPRWSQTLGCEETLGGLVKHLRNAVAHGRIRFSSNSHDLSEVEIMVEDYSPKTDKIVWQASMQASDLKAFCYRFIDLIEDSIG